MIQEEKSTQPESPIPSRRKFVRGVGILSALAAFAAAKGLPFSLDKKVIACAPEKNIKTVKMLTRDGKLVEIDEALIKGKSNKLSNTELQHWIIKK